MRVKIENLMLVFWRICAVFLMFFCMPVACAQTTGTTYYGRPTRPWDSVSTLKADVLAGVGNTTPFFDGDMVYAGGYGYAWAGNDEKIVPSFKSNRSLFLGLQARLDMAQNPLTPYVDLNVQEGIMTMHTFDYNTDVELQRNVYRRIVLSRMAAGVGLEWKHFHFGGGWAFGYIGGGKMDGKGLPFVTYSVKDNHLYWKRHMFTGPEVFVGIRYQKWTVQATAGWSYMHNLGGDYMHAFRLVLGYRIFERT